MAGPGGIQPVVVPLTAPQAPPSGLRAGQLFQAVVQGQPGSLSVTIGGTRVPIGDLPQLNPGQVVNGEVLRSDAGLQLRLNPQPVPVSEQAATAVSLPQVVAHVLETLSALGAAENAAHVLHPAMPANEAAVRNVLELFLADGRTGDALRNLQAMINDAAQAGALSQRLADSFGLLAGVLVLSGGRDIHALLQQWRRAGQTIEHRLAQAMQSGRLDEILSIAEGDLRGLIMRLLHEESFVRFLRGDGRLRAFQETAEEVLERLTGAALQNLRGLEHPYLFVEVPTTPETGFHRLQLHFMSERGAAGKRFDIRNCTAVIDISLSELGDLWIVLKLVEGQCSCLVRAASTEGLERLRHEEAGFAASLGAAGFHGAQVRFALWDANRLRETGQLMRQHSRVDMRA